MDLVDSLTQTFGGNNATEDYYSFSSDDSFELLVSGPAILPPRPSFVPPLNFYNLEGYVSSDTEDEDVTQQNEYQKAVNQGVQPAYYNQSLKYIENFYTQTAIKQMAPAAPHHVQ